MNDFIRSAHRTIELEAQAVTQLKQKTNAEFVAACDLIINCSGKVVVTGIGKSGHIACKIAATLASTGTPSFFVHSAEAAHGDLGMLTDNDIVIAVSGSGKTREILDIIPAIKRLSVPLISIVGDTQSTLAKQSEVVLDASVETEACPLGLAPTSSTTVALVIGDAIAIALLENRGFSADDFAFSHPGGALGKRLLLKVSDAMASNFPQVSEATTVTDALVEISKHGLGMTTVLDSLGNLLGVFTDGDLRRCMNQHQNPGACLLADVMTRGCKTIKATALAAEALKIMQDCSISSLVVVDNDKQVQGVIHIHELIRAGLA